MSAELVETWAINDRINRYMLDASAPEALVTKPAKGRSVGEMFAHLHNVRIDWLKSGDPHAPGRTREAGKGRSDA